MNKKIGDDHGSGNYVFRGVGGLVRLGVQITVKRRGGTGVSNMIFSTYPYLLVLTPLVNISGFDHTFVELSLSWLLSRELIDRHYRMSADSECCWRAWLGVA